MEILKLEHLAWDLPDGAGIIKDIDLSLESGKLVVVTGPNGGGKTTLAKLIAGIQTPSSGRLFFEGQEITNMDITERAKMCIRDSCCALSPNSAAAFKALTTCARTASVPAASRAPTSKLNRKRKDRAL